MFLFRGHMYILTFNLLWCMVPGQKLCSTVGCSCNPIYIECIGIPLTTISLRTGVDDEHIKNIRLQDNQIQEIPKNSLPIGLRLLIISENPIRHIDPDAFNGSTSTLTQLELSDAVFTELPNALFMLDSLRSFTLRNTPITNWNVTILSQLGRTVHTMSLFQVDLRPWPEGFKLFTQLTSLDIRTALIKDIPEDAFTDLSDSLKYLRLENSSLKQVPKALLQLRSVKVYLSSNSIEYLENISEVTELDLSHNLLSDTDNVVQALQASANSLTTLSLSYNQLTSIPNLSSFTSLKKVRLDHNKILTDSNPITSDSSRELDILSLSYNQLTFIPDISGFPFLSELTLDNNRIISGPTSDSPVLAESLRTLILSNNRLTSLSNLPRSPVLKYLALDNNEISDLMFESYLSDSLQVSANSLETLILSFNQFTVIFNLSNFSVLKSLQLQFNNISDSTSWSLPSSLKLLNLHKNMLHAIPTVIKGLSQLHILNLSFNAIFEFNSTIIPSQLSTLSLSFNLISRLDKNSFPEKCTLNTLYLNSNPIEYISDSGFDNVNYLTTLDLSSTSLTNLPVALSSLRRLQTLSMYNISTLLCPCPMPRTLIQWFKTSPFQNQIKGDCGNKKLEISSALLQATFVSGFQCETTPAPLEQTMIQSNNSGFNLVVDIRSIIISDFFCLIYLYQI